MVSRVSSNVMIVSFVKTGSYRILQAFQACSRFLLLCLLPGCSIPPLGDAAVLKAPLLRNWPTRREEEFCKEMDELRQRIVADTTIKENTTASRKDMEQKKTIQYRLTKDASNERVWL